VRAWADSVAPPVAIVADDGAAPEFADDAVQVALARRDRRAFAPLYRRYVESIYRYCYRRLGSHEVAEDATSMVFTRALAALPGYRDGAGSFRSWLFAIAHNVVANDLRDRRPTVGLDAVGGVRDEGAGPEDRALAADDRRRLDELLSRLTPDQRQVIELRLAGLSGAEIARALGRTHGAVKVAQLRAIRRLRRLLDDAASEGVADE
jgi:RNA polymerase sigma-70 factor, ECF subfamily